MAVVEGMRGGKGEASEQAMWYLWYTEGGSVHGRQGWWGTAVLQGTVVASGDGR